MRQDGFECWGVRGPRRSDDLRVPVATAARHVVAPPRAVLMAAAVRGIPAQAEKSNKVRRPGCDKGYAMRVPGDAVWVIRSLITDLCHCRECPFAWSGCRRATEKRCHQSGMSAFTGAIREESVYGLCNLPCTS